ncbi:MAG: serine--tRNA ligase, partial [Romboutsia sp.]|nr:serine--tRNA ligase [Romboutsia sp.]
MLDIKRIRENLEDIKKAMDRRGEKEFDLDAVVALDDKRRELLKEVEVMKNELNVESKKIPQLIKEGKDVDAAKAQLKELSDKIKAIDEQVRTVEGEMEYNLMRIPNVPHPDVPQGTTDEDNVEIRQWGETPKFDFEGKAHWDIGTGLGILDFETAGKITGSRFTLYKGLGARLERAIINFFLNTHTEEHGYTEVLPPFMANRTSFIGTGQLPKFEEDMFKIEGMEYFLIPTAEVPVTNIHRDEILTADQLPIKYCAYTPCFRSEAGSAGRDTRGLVRQHQFNKVEMVKIVHPDKSYDFHEQMLKEATDILEMLELPYRILLLCSGDISFAAAKCYDIETWSPAENKWLEAS